MRDDSQIISSLSAIEHILTHRPERIQYLWIQSGPKSERLRSIETLAVRLKIPMATFDPRREPNEPVRAKLRPFSFIDLKEFISSQKEQAQSIVVALDHIQDPQNLGAICRTAEGLGVQGVVLPTHRGCPVTSGVYHASVGAVETLPMVAVHNLGEALRKFKEANFWIIGTSLSNDSKLLSEMPDFNKIVLVFGAEGEGLASLTEKLCDWQLRIPLKGKVQSLNVSATAAILLHELLKRF